MPAPAQHPIHCYIPHEYAGQRFDVALAKLLPAYSRARLQEWIKTGHIRLDGRVCQPRARVMGGELASGDCPALPSFELHAQAIALDIRYQDEALIVLNKPPGLVAHPAAGNPGGTLLNALLYHAPELAALPRAGLVHRLDKDTSGLLVVARTLTAHADLVRQLQARTLGREYQAIVHGVVAAGSHISAPIGRHPRDRKRMAVVAHGKPATTHYQVAERFLAHSRLQVRLETGRTHQIRVHLAHLRLPLVGDPVYGARAARRAAWPEAYHAAIDRFPRQALHAARLELTHPVSGERCCWQADLPEDMTELVDVLRAYSSS